MSIINTYKAKIKEDNLDNFFTNLNRRDILKVDDIEEICDNFNKLYNPNDNIQLPSRYYCYHLQYLMLRLHLRDRFKIEKCAKLRRFLTIQYLTSNRRSPSSDFNQLDADDFIKLIRSVHTELGQDFIDNIIIDIGVGNNAISYTSNSKLFIYLQLTSKYSNLVNFINYYISNEVDSRHKFRIHEIMYYCYKLRDLGENFEIILKILSSRTLENRKYFNSQTLSDSVEFGNLHDLKKLIEVYEYCFNQGYINQKDINFINRAIMRYDL